MKKSILTLILMVAMLPLMASSYVQLADGVYQDGTTLYICSGVTSLGDLQVNPSEIYCYATIPPACVSNTFTGYDATLHVPVAGMVSYFTTLYWYNFNNILSDAIEPLLVTMNTADAELEIGQQLSLTATVTPGDATPKTVYWSSTDASVATVSGGNVTAVAVGECDILATCVDKVAVCHVTVVNPRVTITLDKHEACLLPNHTMTLTATCSPINVDLAVTSSNLGVAIPRLVNGTIMVVGVSEGTATITVNAADGWGHPDSCVVIVYTEHGDVNCDGYVNINDVTALINYLLSGEQPSDKADTNQDGKVSIGDVTTLINYLLSGRWPWDPEEPAEPETEMFTVNGVTFKMVYVKGGTFTMGATAELGSDDPYGERPAHQVTLSGYAIGETEVTQALWLAIMGSNPSSFNNNLQRPVVRVSWNDCQAFISKLNELTGKTFRLPTEAEWEYAARGGNKSQGYKFAGSDTIGGVAWYYGNSFALGSSSPDYGTHAVATKMPNELDLYDMSGNAWEWCQDWYGNYSSDAQTNPEGPTNGSHRVMRGGSWFDEEGLCRVSMRSTNLPTEKNNVIGLRLALSSDNDPTPEEHEWVDLGLPSGTLWATCNVGASYPEEYGDYFAWGETSPKDEYSINTYKWYTNGTSITKYGGSADNKTELDPEDDAAYVNWGDKWRMPSSDQLTELLTQCTWTWTKRNGVNGRLVTGLNGNTLFWPAAGEIIDRSLQFAGSNGWYWSRTLWRTDVPSGAYAVDFDSERVAENVLERRYGHNVRPVRVSQK